MGRPALEVADIFRDHGPAWRRANQGHLSHSQMKVMGAIEVTGGSVTVTSAHTGFLMGLLALPGERVRADQPLAWVRVLG